MGVVAGTTASRGKVSGVDSSEAVFCGGGFEGGMIDGGEAIATAFGSSPFSVPGRPKTEKSAATMIAAAIKPNRR